MFLIRLRSYRMRKQFTFLFFLLQYFSSAQNLIPNPGFEQHDENRVFEWIQPAIPYYHFQYTYDSLSVPHSGTCLNGICLRENEDNEYLQVELKETLKKDQHYYLSMYVRLPHVWESKMTHVDWYFSQKEGSAKDIQAYLLLKPQVQFDLPEDASTVEWMLLEKTYIADGTERFLKVGHFPSEKEMEIYAKQKEELDTEYAKLKARANENRGKKGEENFRKEINELSNKRKLLGRSKVRTQFLFDDFCLSPIKEDSSSDCREGKLLAEVGATIEIKNIFFETGKAELLGRSFEELDRLTTLLNENSGMEIQINGHTDNQGNDGLNQQLSSDRAKAVMEYLMLKGISEERLTYKGYGSAVPIADNRTEEGRIKNRRVEFTIKKIR
jgi:outer membrane protein OmpA-like peptidoglycan-associated protein